MFRLRALLIVAGLAVTACADPPVAPLPTLVGGGQVASLATEERTYIVLGAGEALPADLDAQVSAAGGTVIATVPEIGVALVQSSSSSFRGELAGVTGIESVTPDMFVEWTPPFDVREGSIDENSELGAAASIGDDEPLFPFQWAPRAIQAPEAWNAGWTGKGVRVAILDGGVLRTHPDLLPNVDDAAGRSFVPGFTYTQDVSSHATHVAGIVAAADNRFGTIGIAPGATLIGVKVLHAGTGSFAALFNGIIYAATPQSDGGAGAQVINMSLGSTLTNTKDKEIKADVRELKKAIDLATKFAYQRGVTVIAAAGNNALDFDDDKGLLALPAENQQVISVSATGPVGWAFRGAMDFERPAYYTNFGKSLVDLAAPGGTDALFTQEKINARCTVAGLRTFCETFDMVLSTTRTGWAWALGTSMATPMVSGVAALIIERNGGSMHPAAVRARLQQGALDHGKPGNDQFYGHGWVNAFRSVQ